MKLCKRCNKEFNYVRSDAKFCSVICTSSYRQETKKDEVRAYKKSHYELNKVFICKQNMDNYYANKLTFELRSCKHCENNFQPTRIDKKFCSQSCGTANWRKNNSEYVKQDQNKRYHEDINRKISSCLRSRLNIALKDNVKSKSTVKLFGCSVADLRLHIESQFEPWMNWDNHGVYSKNRKTWHFDHIRPLGSFDLSDPKQQQDACHFSNIRPFLAISNLMKGPKYE